MATVTRDSKGVRIWFKDGAGKRKSIRLGDAHDDYATRFALNLEDLNSAVKLQHDHSPRDRPVGYGAL